MSEPQAETRIERHRSLAGTFERLRDDEFSEWLGPPGQGSGWGDSRPVDFNGTPVFVKRLRVTSRELVAPYSTRNVFDLPLFYSYGVGSAGFGAFREVAGHELANGLVLEGRCTQFPLMHHVRVLKREPAPSRPVTARHQEYISFWNGSRAVEAYMTDRRAAGHEAVVVLEYVPHTLASWLPEHPEAIDDVIDQLFATVSHLREAGIVHFDAHFSNVVTDGETQFLTDFGLLMSPEFELDSAEREFLARHIDYDYGEILYSLGMQVGWHVGRLEADAQKRLKDAMGMEGELLSGGSFYELMVRFEEVSQLTPLPAALLGAIERFRGPMVHLGEFLETLRADPRKDTPYDGPRLRSLLLDAGVPV